MSNNEHITLKEAAQLSGYSSDYIGQLIRKGKIPGKQVYSNVAWVTTQEAVLEYMSNKDAVQKQSKAAGALVWKNVLSWEKALEGLLWFVILVATAFLLLLFHVFSISLEKKLYSGTFGQVVHVQEESQPYASR